MWGESDALRTVYLLYSYHRGDDLGYFAVDALTQEVVVTRRLIVEAEGVRYLAEETQGLGGAEESGEWELGAAAAAALPPPRKSAAVVEEALEQIVGEATGCNVGVPDLTPEAELALMEAALASPYWPDQRNAVRRLEFTDPDEVGIGLLQYAIRLLVDQLKSPAEMVREAAEGALGHLHEDYPPLL